MANVNSTQTSFKIRLDLYDKLRFQAVKENRTQGEILNEALEDYLQKVENQTKLEWKKMIIKIELNINKKFNR